MKKLLIFIFLFFSFSNSINALEKYEVKFSSCIDGDTARFIFDNENIKVRFLAIDTPETKHPKKSVELYGKEASNYTCNKLKSASKIILEFDSNSDLKDKYNRYLAWVFIDDILLQEELVSNGYAEVKYLYGDYKYTEKLLNKEKIAKKEKLGIWNNYKEEFNLKDYIINLDFKFKILITIIIILIISLYLYIDKKTRKKLLKKGKRKIKNDIKRKMKDL